MSQATADRATKWAFGLIGSIGSVITTYTMVFEMCTILKRRNTISLSSLSSLGVVLSSSMTAFYAVVTSEMDYIFSSVICLAVALCHLVFFYWYSSFDDRTTIAAVATVDVGLIGMILLLWLTLPDDPTSQIRISHFVGVLYIIAGSITYILPVIVALKEAYKSKKKAIKSISIFASLAGCFTCFVWILYALMDANHIDVITLVPNAIGVITGVFQVFLLHYFPRDQPEWHKYFEEDTLSNLFKEEDIWWDYLRGDVLQNLFEAEAAWWQLLDGAVCKKLFDSEEAWWQLPDGTVCQKLFDSEYAWWQLLDGVVLQNLLYDEDEPILDGDILRTLFNDEENFMALPHDEMRLHGPHVIIDIPHGLVSDVHDGDILPTI